MKTILKVLLFLSIWAIALAPTMAILDGTGHVPTEELPTGTGGYTPPTGTGWTHITNGVQDAAATTPTAAQVGADAAGVAVACTTGIGTKIKNDTAGLGTALKNDTTGMKNDTAGMGTALAGKSATSHTHTTIDTCNIRALKTPKADSMNVLAGLRCKKLVVGAGTLMLDSIEVKDGTVDSLIIGAFGKRWAITLPAK
jgi:hypothetical protein